MPPTPTGTQYRNTTENAEKLEIFLYCASQESGTCTIVGSTLMCYNIYSSRGGSTHVLLRCCEPFAPGQLKNIHPLDFAVLIGIVTLEAAIKGAAVIIALIIAFTAPAPANAPASASAPAKAAITAQVVHQPLTVDQLIAQHTQRELMVMAGTKSKRSKKQLAEKILQIKN